MITLWMLCFTSSRLFEGQETQQEGPTGENEAAGLK